MKVTGRSDKVGEVNKVTEYEVDISLDPKHFLQVETNVVLQLPSGVVEGFETSEGWHSLFTCVKRL